MRVAVAGATGRIGSLTVAALDARGMKFDDWLAAQVRS
jgi:uncharacterized protein YbjT (DUF2867 family)